MYGKKKRSLLPSLSGFRGSAAAQKSRKDTDTLNHSGLPCSASTSASNQADSLQPIPTQHVDAIDELASMLLDDTILEEDKPRIEPSKCLPLSSSAQTMPSLSNAAAHGNKSLPQLPSLIFNGDDAWAMRAAPVVTAEGAFNKTHFEPEEESILTPPTHLARHARQRSGPPVPRKSSRRRSTRPKMTTSKPLPSPDVMNSSRQEDMGCKPSTMTVGDEINKKIEAMLAANQALKSSQKMSSSPARADGPFFPSKKRRLKENKVLGKMKTAINQRFLGRSARARRNSVVEDHLLDNSSNDTLDDGEEVISNTEIRMNEGFNLRIEKVKTVSGHGYIGRKPIANGGRSLYSKISSTVSSPERPQPIGLIRTSTGYGNRMDHGLASDQEALTDFPSRTPPRRREAQSENSRCSPSIGKRDSRSSLHISDISDPPSRVQTPKNHLRRAKKTANLAYEADLDALFSSSPVGHSTPRIRLEPTEDEGRRMLKSVPAETRSIFDSEMAMGVDHIATGSQMRPIASNRTKKHPSPSKRELEELEHALGQFNVFPQSAPESFMARSSSKEFNHRLAPSSVLGKADANTAIRGQKVLGRGRLAARTSPMTRSSGSVSLLSRSKQQQATATQEDLMDIDELQWDDSLYNIGMKRGRD